MREFDFCFIVFAVVHLKIPKIKTCSDSNFFIVSEIHSLMSHHQYQQQFLLCFLPSFSENHSAINEI